MQISSLYHQRFSGIFIQIFNNNRKKKSFSLDIFYPTPPFTQKQTIRNTKKTKKKLLGKQKQKQKHNENKNKK